MLNNDCFACSGCLDPHNHALYKCIPCECEVDSLCGLDEDDVDEEDVNEDPHPPKSPYSRYQPPSYGCYPPFPKPQPDLTQELLKALLAAHESHIKTLQESHKRELELLLMMQERKHHEDRPREKTS
jgi:hypothetical protein